MGYGDPAFWLSAKGRVDRRRFIVASLVVSLAPVAFAFVFAGQWALSVAFSALATYSGIVLTIKRAHDRGRSGWFTLLILVPLVGLWPLIELGACKGEAGDNEYGPPDGETRSSPGLTSSFTA